jgi:hypothetical protein
MIHSIICGTLILFFAWMLLHALIYSKSKNRIIEGLETTSPTAPAPVNPVNPAEVEFLKQQVASLQATAGKLNAAMIQNEAGVKNNEELVQKVVKSQSDTNAKLANMKSAQ